MGENIFILLFWLIGWFIFSIGYYIYKLYINKTYLPKCLLVWRSFKYGILSWFGIVFIVSYTLTGYLFKIDELIENKLK